MIIWFDLDGVLADFDGEFARLTGLDWKERIEETWKEKWAAINAHPEFFLNLPWVEGARELWDWCAGFDRRVLSAASSNCLPSLTHKLQWCHRELGMSGNAVVIVGHRRQKATFATPDGILIDDKLENIQEWVKAGGIGIVFETASQVRKELETFLRLD